MDIQINEPYDITPFIVFTDSVENSWFESDSNKPYEIEKLTEIDLQRLLSGDKPRLTKLTEEGIKAFDKLVEKWHQERGVTSSIERMTCCPAYLTIIRLGEDALPFIFEKMKTEEGRDWWFPALEIITGANPVVEEDWGKVKQMTQKWITWFNLNYGW
jgi:hypothetical protein